MARKRRTKVVNAAAAERGRQGGLKSIADRKRDPKTGRLLPRDPAPPAPPGDDPPAPPPEDGPPFVELRRRWSPIRRGS